MGSILGRVRLHLYLMRRTGKEAPVTQDVYPGYGNLDALKICHVQIIHSRNRAQLQVQPPGTQCLQARRQQRALAGRYIYVSQSSLLFNGLFASDGPTSLLNASFVLFGFFPEVIRAEFFGCYGFVPFQTSCGVLGIFL